MFNYKNIHGLFVAFTIVVSSAYSNPDYEFELKSSAPVRLGRPASNLIALASEEGSYLIFSPSSQLIAKVNGPLWEELLSPGNKSGEEVSILQSALPTPSSPARESVDVTPTPLTFKLPAETDITASVSLPLLRLWAFLGRNSLKGAILEAAWEQSWEAYITLQKDYTWRYKVSPIFQNISWGTTETALVHGLSHLLPAPAGTMLTTLHAGFYGAWLITHRNAPASDIQWFVSNLTTHALLYYSFAN